MATCRCWLLPLLTGALLTGLCAAAGATPTDSFMHVYTDGYPFRWRDDRPGAEWHETTSNVADLPILDAQKKPIVYQFEVSHRGGFFRVYRASAVQSAEQYVSDDFHLKGTWEYDIVRIVSTGASAALLACIVIAALLWRGRRLRRALALTAVHLTEAQARRGFFPMDGSLPEHIDQYEVLRKLGAGGMAVVFQVRRDGQDYALKLPLPTVMGHADFRARFVREMKLGMTLQHPNLVHIFDVNDGSDGCGYPYLVMEYIDGRALENRLEDGPLSFTEAARAALQVLDALTSIHARGIVHRDIKPSNVMITRTGNAKLMDFGIAFRQETVGPRITQSGDILGTPLYLAPEQAFGGVVDARSDVYGVGMMLYELLAGCLPWKGIDSMSIMNEKVNTDAPALSRYRRDVPRPLEAVVMRMIARDPDHRFATAAAAREALRAAMARIR